MVLSEQIPASEVKKVEPFVGAYSEQITEVAKRIRLQMGGKAQGQEFKDLLVRATDMLDQYVAVCAAYEATIKQ